LNLHGKRVRAGRRVFFEVDVRRRVRRRRKSEYESVRGVLVKIWEILGYPSPSHAPENTGKMITAMWSKRTILWSENMRDISDMIGKKNSKPYRNSTSGYGYISTSSSQSSRRSPR
jgi:hypothetical protein